MNYGTNEHYQILVNRSWSTVNEYIFRSWTGPRRLNGVDFHGPIYYLGTDKPIDYTPPT